MVMRVMLIGLLVIGAVAMLETDVSGHPECFVWRCCGDSTQLKEVVEWVKKDENIQIWLIGDTARRRADVREMLIQLGLEPEIIGELNYEDPALLEYMRKERHMREGQTPVIVAQPKYK